MRDIPEAFEYDARYDLPPFTGEPRDYLLATTQRTGSHYFAHLLARTAWAGVPFEYLNPYRVALELQARQVAITPSAEAELLREVRSRRTGSTGLFGVKAHWHSWHGAQLRPGIGPLVMPTAIVFLSRRDRAAQARSLATAEQTGVWVDFGSAADRRGRRCGTPALTAAQVADARRRLEAEYESWSDYLASWSGPVLSLTYEDLREDPAEAVRMTAEFFGAPAAGDYRDLPMPRPTRAHLVNA